MREWIFWYLLNQERPIFRHSKYAATLQRTSVSRPSRWHDRLVPCRFSEPKSIPVDQRKRRIVDPLSRIHKGGLACLLQILAILIGHPMRALVPNDNHILLNNLPTASAPGPPQDLIAVLELGGNYLGSMPAGAENLDGVSFPAADSLRHGHLSNLAGSTALPPHLSRRTGQRRLKPTGK